MDVVLGSVMDDEDDGNHSDRFYRYDEDDDDDGEGMPSSTDGI